MDDERLAKIEQEKQTALNESKNIYNGLLQDNQNLYNQQNAYAEDYEKTQNDILDKQLAFREDQIEKQKEVARQNKETEEKKALNDYTAYNNPYGYQAESMADSGLLSSGVSETSKLGSWNAYQNRLATANKVMQDAFTQYDADINEARLNNDTQKAQNALAKLQMQIQFAQDFTSNKNNLTLSQLSYNQNLDDSYFNRYQTEYNNIQNEKAREEAIRQFNETLAFQKEQAAQSQANWEKEYALSKYNTYNSGGGISGGITSGDGLTGTNDLGNNSNTMKKDDYYFSNGYQPRYMFNQKLAETGLKSQDIGVEALGKDKNVWKAADGNYYVWKTDQYYKVTDQFNAATKKQTTSSKTSASSVSATSSAKTTPKVSVTNENLSYVTTPTQVSSVKQPYYNPNTLTTYKDYYK